MNAAASLRIGQPLVGLPKICIRQISHSGKPKKPQAGFVGPEGHGEKIWIWAHRRTDQTLYTLRDHLNDVQDLKQIPFNGKKLKQSSLRKDYWSPMAILNFPAGKGEVGRSVFQKLRELKHLHEVSWPEELRIKPDEELSKTEQRLVKRAKEEGRLYVPVRTKKERGIALNAQKPNTIADMAVVLAGEGPGNKMKAAESGDLETVTIKWANDQDKNYAQVWSENVTHDLVEDPSYVAGEAQPESAASAPTFQPRAQTA